MGKIISTVACNLDAAILSACLPLLEEEKIGALEWAFDALYNQTEIPVWFEDLLQAYSKANRLIGHGVFFSLFSGKWSAGQASWLQHLKTSCNRYQFDHITEHFGFMTGRNFHHGAPLSVPYTPEVLAIGIDRLQRIAEACACPVGLENLAFSYSVENVKRHGEFLYQLIEPVNGFIILDLHNLYCQSHNFNQPFETLLQLYPLEKVREIHISGGSWEPSQLAPNEKVRRDTHDDKVPAEVFEMLQATMPQCPHLKYVVLEQLGNGLLSNSSRHVFYEDFMRMDNLIQQENSCRTGNELNVFLPHITANSTQVAEDLLLHQQQTELSGILETSTTLPELMHALQTSSLVNSHWQIEQWQPYMIETAWQIAQKWKQPQP